MKPHILIIGSGGSTKYDYLDQLDKLGAEIILLEPENKNPHPKYKTFFCSFKDVKTIIEKAKEIASNFSIKYVDTIFELTMEAVAEVRVALSLPGLTPDLVNVGRKKTIMAQFMKEHGIRTAPFIIFDRDDPLEKVREEMLKYKDTSWILRPDCLGANIGVRRIKNANDFIKIYNEAQYDITNHPYNNYIFYETAKKWIVCKYIEGHEIETEVCIHKGEIIFTAYLFKTISNETQYGIEENRYITPVPWLKKDQLKDLDIQIQKIGKHVYEHIMKPVNKKTLVIHPEFLIDKHNNAYTIEFAFRNGGGLNPSRIKESTGINPYYLSAAATLDMDLDIKTKDKITGSGYQMIFSDRPGTFEEIKGIEEFEGLSIISDASPGYKIATPQAEALTSLTFSADTSEEVDRMLNRAVKNAKVIVDGREINVPVSDFV